MNLSLLYATATVALAATIGSWTAPSPSPAVSATAAATDAQIVSAGPMTARVDVATRYAPIVRRLAAGYLDGSETPDRAWAVARTRLLALGDGRAFVASLERGDLQSAVRLLPAMRWPDGSAVTL
jgi:hypothetical protein